MARKPRIAPPRRGDVYLVSFDPTLGAEIRKTRPALVLQNEVANRWSSIVIVAAISSRSRVDEPAYPTEVRVEPPEARLIAPSMVLLSQIRSLDKRRLIKRLGRLRRDTMKLVDRALQISLGLAGV